MNGGSTCPNFESRRAVPVEGERQKLTLDLYFALTDSHRRHYEDLRETIIDRLGYDTFRDIQRDAFLLVNRKDAP